jgi:phosphoesterase RecJ-like protein
MFLGGPAPLPGEYRFLELADRGLLRDLPADAGERVLVAVDCASAGRVGAEPGLVERAPYTINIDHHHDNPRFGDVNLIVPDASSTGEVLADVFRELGVALTPEIAEALYIALVTDTGRFTRERDAEGPPARGGAARRPARTFTACSRACTRTSSSRS